jgi:hypothetical protein
MALYVLDTFQNKFERAVDDMGCVYMTVDKRYHPPEHWPRAPWGARGPASTDAAQLSRLGATARSRRRRR